VQFVTAADPDGDRELDGHWMHWMPSPSPYVFAGQAVQYEAPPSGATVPAEQEVQIGAG
jgi:hypothetical protein